MARMSESTFLSSDGKTQLYYRVYLPEDEAVGIVQLVHGIAEHISRYDDFANFLADHGYIVAGHDQLGHGMSSLNESTLGFFSEKDGWEKAVEDIHTLHDIVAERFPGKPYILFGHSMGSFLARTYLIQYKSGLDGAIISGTGQQSRALVTGGRLMSALEMRRHGATYKSTLLNNMAFGSYTKKLGHVRTPSDWLSRDEENVKAYMADPLCGFPFTPYGYADLMGAMGHIANAKWAAKVPNRPILLISGDMDPVGGMGKGVKKVDRYLENSGHTRVTFKLYPGARHEILNETNRKEVYADVLLFLEAVAAGGELE